MLTDMFGKELKVGDQILYPIATGRSSASIFKMTLVSVTENEYDRGWRKGEKYFTASARYESKGNGKAVTIRYPNRAIRVTGLELGVLSGQGE